MAEKPAAPAYPGKVVGRRRVELRRVQSVDDILSEVFERVRDVFDKKSPADAMSFLLDLALEKIPSESGLVFRADTDLADPVLVAARGPRIPLPAAPEILKLCVSTGVSVARRGLKGGATRDGHSVLCSPMMMKGRVFGAMQLVDRQEAPSFLDHETILLAYIAHHGALYLDAASSKPDK